MRLFTGSFYSLWCRSQKHPQNTGKDTSSWASAQTTQTKIASQRLKGKSQYITTFSLMIAYYCVNHYDSTHRNKNVNIYENINRKKSDKLSRYPVWNCAHVACVLFNYFNKFSIACTSKSSKTCEIWFQKNFIFNSDKECIVGQIITSKTYTMFTASWWSQQ